MADRSLRRFRRGYFSCLGWLCLMLAQPIALHGADEDRAECGLGSGVACARPVFELDVGAGASGRFTRIQLERRRAMLVETPFDVSRVAVGDAKIADVVVVSPRQVNIVPLRIGETNLLLWDSEGALAAAIELEVGSARLRVSAGVFAQANGPLLESLSEAVLEASGSARRAVELYAGAGLFTLGLAQRFEQLLAVEANARATADLTFNLERAGQGARVEVLTQPVARSLARVAAFEPDVVVLDPPRSGLDRGCAERLGAVAARRIVYVSCDPATLARDLRGLCRTGYSLRQLRAFDLFPQTHHVEAVAVLEHG